MEERIDDVLTQNRRIEWLYIALTVLLFAVGIICIVTALVSGEMAWSIPSTFTTGLLYFPLRSINEIRQKNIALAVAPVLISELPAEVAAKEIQKMLEHLFGTDSNG
jgi:hypothetical protein